MYIVFGKAKEVLLLIRESGSKDYVEMALEYVCVSLEWSSTSLDARRAQPTVGSC